METVLRYLKQPSTQRFIVTIAGLIGWQLNPENVELVVGGVVGLLAIIEGVRDEDKVQPLGGGDDSVPPKKD